MRVRPKLNACPSGRSSGISRKCAILGADRRMSRSLSPEPPSDFRIAATDFDQSPSASTVFNAHFFRAVYDLA